jgi:hypothetical protein
MSKKSFFSALILVAFVTASAYAQSIVDPGTSTHNYKHPNKAAKAKARGTQNSVTVANANTVENYYKMQNRGKYVNTTPKYAPRPSSLVLIRTYDKEGVDINPLVNPRNYKTPTNAPKAAVNTEVADFFSKDSTAYPNID